MQGELGHFEDGSEALPVGCTGGNVYNNVIIDGQRRATPAFTTTTLTAGQPVELVVGGGTLQVRGAQGTFPVAGISRSAAAAGSVAVIGTHGLFSVTAPGGLSGFTQSGPSTIRP